MNLPFYVYLPIVGGIVGGIIGGYYHKRQKENQRNKGK